MFPILLALAMTGCGDGEPKSYPVLDAPLPPAPPGSELSATVILEMIEVDGEMLSDWHLSNKLEPTRATPLRKTAQDWVRNGRARLVETAVIQGKDGVRSVSSIPTLLVFVRADLNRPKL